MCGIAGILSDNIDLRDKKEMIWKISNSLKMRGPDARGEYVTKNAALIHRRLSVIDVKNGAQPMRFGKYIIVYNGELYNTDEIRSELIRHGYKFDTQCDTEVVLKAFHMWHEESAKRFNGIYAYAIYNEENNELFLCRDRIGVKPLYYSKNKTAFSFASKLESLLYVDGVEPVCNREGLCEIFMLGPAKTIGKTVFRDIKELPPACWMYYKNGKVETKEYWHLEATPFEDSELEAQERTHFLVTDAIRRQLVSDVPLCTFLSGGLDSSIISKVASDYYKDKNKRLSTYSVDYVDNDKYFKSDVFQPNKDSDYINLISDYIDSDHHNIVLSNSAVADALVDAAIARGCPGFTDIDSSLLLFCREVKKNYTVCLSGECADEIFGGYPWFYRPELMNRDGFPWSADPAARTSILSDDVLRTLDLAEYSHARYEETLSHVPHLDGESPEEARRRDIGYLNIKWFMQTLLDRMDRTSMYSSLEARVPFADHRIMEYVFNVPWQMKYRNGVEKSLLRDACADLLPRELLWRKKSPYPKTYHPAYEQMLIRRMREILNDPNSPVLPLLDRSKTEAFLAAPKELGKPWFGQLMAGPQLIAYFIQINTWMQIYHLSI